MSWPGCGVSPPGPAADLDRAHILQPDFLHLTRDEVGKKPPAGSAGWHLYKAWEQGMATPLLNIARVHKMLHHKRPCLVPLWMVTRGRAAIPPR